jgi:hypothetical protein
MTEKDKDMLRHPSSSDTDEHFMPEFSFRERAISNEELKVIGIATIAACVPFVATDVVDILHTVGDYIGTRYAEAWKGFR